MPELKCTVQTCVHNKQFLCDLEAIEVGGSSAKNTEDTCCDSFEERKEGGYSNHYSDSYGDVSSAMPSAASSVDCKATECMYNNECRCHAGKISVEGSEACHSSDTECATFHAANPVSTAAQ